jgi:glycosyltransferase involved in cell wall biosynthesis
VKTPKVSVVLTTYKRAQLLAATVESILAQTLKDFELVISDDASPDETERVARDLERRDPRVRYRRGAKNVGMPGNLNAGIAASSAEYIANLHDGDIYEPTLLEKWAAALDAFPRAGFVFNAYRCIGANGQTRCIFKESLGPCVPGPVLLEEIVFRRWRFDCPVWGTVMGRRSAYLDVGLFDPRFGFVSDVDMWFRLAERYDVAYIAEPLITLPSRDTVPRLWGSTAERLTRQYARQMVWEARMRHYRDRPLRRVGEALRHWGFVSAYRGWLLACEVNRLRRRLLPSAGRGAGAVKGEGDRPTVTE